MASNNDQNHRNDIDVRLKKAREIAESGSKIFDKRYIMDMGDDVIKEESDSLGLSYSELQEVMEDELLHKLVKMKEKEVALEKNIEGLRKDLRDLNALDQEVSESSNKKIEQKKQIARDEQKRTELNEEDLQKRMMEDLEQLHQKRIDELTPAGKEVLDDLLNLTAKMSKRRDAVQKKIETLALNDMEVLDDLLKIYSKKRQREGEDKLY